jgi:ribosomal-protein-alanine N-acetyltransferase
MQYSSLTNIVIFNNCNITVMELNGRDFILRELNLADAPTLQLHANNPNISRFLFNRFPLPYTLEDAEYFINSKVGQDPITCFAIAINEDVIGIISLEFRIDVYTKAPLLGYWVSEQYWGKGIVTEAVKLITDYAFKHLDIISIRAVVFDNNPVSMRVLEKAGYLKEGILKNNIFKNGEILDEHIYGIVKKNIN